MPPLDTLSAVRTRIGRKIAEIESRSTRPKEVDMCARMAAIRSMAAAHGLAIRAR